MSRRLCTLGDAAKYLGVQYQKARTVAIKRRLIKGYLDTSGKVLRGPLVDIIELAEVMGISKPDNPPVSLKEICIYSLEDAKPPTQKQPKPTEVTNFPAGFELQGVYYHCNIWAFKDEETGRWIRGVKASGKPIDIRTEDLYQLIKEGKLKPLDPHKLLEALQELIKREEAKNDDNR